MRLWNAVIKSAQSYDKDTNTSWEIYNIGSFLTITCISAPAIIIIIEVYGAYDNVSMIVCFL